MLTSVCTICAPARLHHRALSSLRAIGERYDETTPDELLNTALSEAERLDRFVGNLSK